MVYLIRLGAWCFHIMQLYYIALWATSEFLKIQSFSRIISLSKNNLNVVAETNINFRMCINAPNLGFSQLHFNVDAIEFRRKFHQSQNVAYWRIFQPDK